MNDDDAVERTFLMIKPDGVRRGLIGEVISRVERKGLKIVEMRMLQVDENTANQHYAEHIGKPFFQDLVDHITSGPSMPMIVEGRNAISVVRLIVGATDPAEAAPGTIRGDLALNITQNIVHAADSPESASREISIYF